MLTTSYSISLRQKGARLQICLGGQKGEAPHEFSTTPTDLFVSSTVPLASSSFVCPVALLRAEPFGFG